MARKQNIKPVNNSSSQGKIVAAEPVGTGNRFNLGLKAFPALDPYLPGILLFALFLIVAFVSYKDYGICWDEPLQRAPGILSFDYVFNGSQDLFKTASDNHGAGYELLLVIFEKVMGLTDSRDIYLMRHFVTNLLFLVSALAAYRLVFRLFRDRFLASMAFLMIVLSPRLYAHSFFNSKDIPFMCMVTIALSYAQSAFEKNRPKAFLIVGLLVGYATSIRIMGVMLACIILFFMVIDLVAGMRKKERPQNQLLNILAFCVGFCALLYLGWPYLWKHPIDNFIDSFSALSHFMWKGSVLINGIFVPATKLQWTYFPTWFLISNPEIWLIAGMAGIVWIVVDFVKSPAVFFRNTNQRQFLIYLACFFGPILSVILLHSVIYDDWRHLYFVYPPFVLMAAYFISKMLHTRFKLAVQVICFIEVDATCMFMVMNHPFNQVYFNYFVGHGNESLRKNYELEYWGSSYKQGLEYLITKVPAGPIRIACENPVLVTNNMLILPPDDRSRIQVTDPEKADYFITNYRSHPYDYPGDKAEYSVSVLNSTILSVFKEEKDPVKLKQTREQTIADLSKAILSNPDDCYAHAQIGDAFFRNGQYDSSVYHHMRALQLNPASVIINDLAGMYFGKQRYREAIDLCKKAVEINPSDVNTFTNMGLCYIRVARYDSAVYALQKAIQIDPKYLSAYINLSLTYKSAGNVDSAKKYETLALKIQAGEKL